MARLLGDEGEDDEAQIALVENPAAAAVTPAEAAMPSAAEPGAASVTPVLATLAPPTFFEPTKHINLV